MAQIRALRHIFRDNLRILHRLQKTAPENKFAKCSRHQKTSSRIRLLPKAISLLHTSDKPPDNRRQGVQILAKTGNSLGVPPETIAVNKRIKPNPLSHLIVPNGENPRIRVSWHERF